MTGLPLVVAALVALAVAYLCGAVSALRLRARLDEQHAHVPAWRRETWRTANADTVRFARIPAQRASAEAEAVAS